MICSLIKLCWYKISGKKLIVINEASGLGDYLWVRSYFRIIKERSTDNRIIFLGTRRWADFAQTLDKNKVDIFFFFQNPYHPRYWELCLLKLFTYDVFINFRKDKPLWEKLNNSIRANKIYPSKPPINENTVGRGFYYPAHNDSIINQFLTLPPDFKHTLPVIHPASTKDIPHQPYILLALGGLTDGQFSLQQLIVLCRALHECFQKPILLLGTTLSYRLLYPYLKGSFLLSAITTFFQTICSYLKKPISLFGITIDKPLYKQLAQHFSPNILLNGCNKFPTCALPYLVQQADFVVSPNTSVWHMAILLQKAGIIYILDDRYWHPLPNEDKLVYCVEKTSCLSKISCEKIETSVQNLKKILDVL